MNKTGRDLTNSMRFRTPNYGRHNLSEKVETTTGIGRLTPTYFTEVLPGDRFTIRPETLVRLMPLVSPVLTRMDVSTFYFHVPFRLLWDNWVNWIMQQNDPNTGLPPVLPTYKRSFNQKSGVYAITPKLSDYFNAPFSSDGTNDIDVTLFLQSAYQCIWNYHFRHQAVEPLEDYKLVDGAVSQGDYVTKYCKMRQIHFDEDAFMSLLPTPQKGDAAVMTLESGLNINIDALPDVNAIRGVLVPGGTTTDMLVPQSSPENQLISDEYNLFAKGEITAEKLREMLAYQQWLERNNAANMQYDDFIKIGFGTDVPDYRVNQPQFLGGVTNPITMTDIANTESANQGRLVSNGTGWAIGQPIETQIFEHGLIIGITVVKYKPSYINACKKLHIKLNPFDYWTQSFDLLGEEPVPHVLAVSDSNKPLEEIGYNPRYWDYRTTFDSVTGQMRDLNAHWLLGRALGENTDGLSPSFYRVVDERDIFAVTDEDLDPIVLQCVTNVEAVRPMSPFPSINFIDGLL